jgi:hypothetical protein
VDRQTAEGLLEHSIHPLCLTIAMSSMSDGHVQLCSNRLEDELPELGDELSVAIGDDTRWHAVVSSEVIDEQPSYALRGDYLLRWNEVVALGKATHDVPD